MTGHPALLPHNPCTSGPMSEHPPSRDSLATPREQEHLETAHHEICTALTVLRSNVELVRVELRHEGDPSTHVTVQRHLTELDMAVERLKRLAAQMRTWHGGGPTDADIEMGARQARDYFPKNNHGQ